MDGQREMNSVVYIGRVGRSRGKGSPLIVRWRDRLRHMVIRGLHAEALRLRHEQDEHRQTGVDPRSGEAAALAQDIAAVTAALGLSPEDEDG
jgi:hypothetical protein